MNGLDDSQKLDLILEEQRKLHILVDKVEVSILDEVVKNRKAINKVAKEVKGIKDVLGDHQKRIISLEDHCPSPVLS